MLITYRGSAGLAPTLKTRAVFETGVLPNGVAVISRLKGSVANAASRTSNEIESIDRAFRPFARCEHNTAPLRRPRRVHIVDALCLVDRL